MSKALDKVIETFDQVAATSSRLDKEALLRALRSDGEANIIAQEALQIALSWYDHYGIRSLPEATGVESVASSWTGFTSTVRRLKGGELIGRQEIANMLASTGPMTEKWLRRILLKDLKMGVSYTTANKVWPGLIATFSCQLADTARNITELEYPVAVEPKVDGVRCIAVVELPKITFVSRSGNTLFNTQLIEDTIRTSGIDHCVLDGELFVDSFQRTMQVVRRSVSAPDPDYLQRLTFVVFDYLTADEWFGRKLPRVYTLRRDGIPNEWLSNELPIQKISSTVVWHKKELVFQAADYLDRGYEGTMIKRLLGIYAFERSSSWLKYKPVESGEFEVLTVYEGQGRHKGRLGGFVIRVGGIQCNVGGGFSDVEREAFWESPPIGKTIEVKYKLLTPDGKLREPVFKGVVDDE